jgi:hypothetical protein
MSIRAPVTPLSGALSATRRLAVVRRSLQTVHEAAHAWDVTINDLVLAGLAGGVRAWLLSRRAELPLRPLRASMPVAVPGRRANAGRIVIVELPVIDQPSPQRLFDISAQTRVLKRDSDVAHTEVTNSDAFPLFLARAGFTWLRRYGGTRVNLYTTNVVGPTSELHLAGARVREVVPIAPLVAGCRLGVTTFSYAGELIVALCADASILDVEVLADGVGAELDWLTAEIPKSAGNRNAYAVSQS